MVAAEANAHVAPRPRPRVDAGACTVVDATADTTFDALIGPACHNCYERRYAESLASALDRVSAIEIDFWDEDVMALGSGRPSAWYVRHGPLSGNDGNITGAGDLADALDDVARWSDAHPGHAPVTVYLDKKQGWGPRRRPRDLDAVLGATLGDRLFTPRALAGDHRSLREAVEAGAWPPVQALRGKIIVALTGGAVSRLGGLLVPNRTQHAYVRDRGLRALAFVAPDTTRPDEVAGIPDGFDALSAPFVVFHNLDADSGELGPLIRASRRVARHWGVGEDDEGYRTATRRCVNAPATYDLSGVVRAAGALVLGLPEP